jgi:hypothetical protein
MNKGLIKGPLMKNAATAPFIYFDGTPAMGTQAGLVEIELCARAVMPQASGEVYSDMVCVAHLRCSTAAATNLRDALNRALGMVDESNAVVRESHDAIPAIKQ